jgi:hypothetical protein
LVGARYRFWFLHGQPEQFTDEPNLTPNILAADPSNLPFLHHVYGLIALNRSPRGLEFPEALLGVDSALDCTMILFEDVIQRFCCEV